MILTTARSLWAQCSAQPARSADEPSFWLPATCGTSETPKTSNALAPVLPRLRCRAPSAGATKLDAASRT